MNDTSFDLAPFDLALAFVLKHEGGFVDHPNDPGGATKYGLSLRAITARGRMDPAWGKFFDKDGDGDVDARDVELFTIEDASRFYVELWKARLLDQIHAPLIAAKIFDLMVVTGFGGASRIAQRSLRACGRRVVEDGAMGRITRASINQVSDDDELLIALCCEAAGYFRDLDKPDFEEGWLNRAYDRPEGTTT